MDQPNPTAALGTNLPYIQRLDRVIQLNVGVWALSANTCRSLIRI